MLAFYPQIKLVHIAAVSASGAFFALRALGLLAGMRWPRMAPVRYLSYTIDTTLLTAAMMLLTILPGELYANGWLAVKIVLLVVYIVLGFMALRPGRGAGTRLACYLGALAVFGFMYSVARAHHPGGIVWLMLAA